MKVGIIGGGAPLAGFFLAQQLVSACQNRLGCLRDADFLTIRFISFPFTDMFSREGCAANQEVVSTQLDGCLKEMADCSIMVISCNTLYISSTLSCKYARSASRC